MSTPIEPSNPTQTDDPIPTLSHPLRSPRQELESFALRRIDSLRRVGSDEVAKVEDAMTRAIELLDEAETDDDPA